MSLEHRYKEQTIHSTEPFGDYFTVDFCRSFAAFISES